MAHPFKVVLDEETVKGLSEAATALRSAQENYRIGVGNVAAILLERLMADHPDLVVEILGIGGDDSSARLKQAALKKPLSKKGGASKPGSAA